MAFETGTATNVSDLYSKLDLFLTEDCGWTLHHSVASNNKVYKSTGSNTKQDIYIRLQKDLKDNKGIPSHIAWQNQTFNGAKYSHINVFASQYWNESTGAASNQTTGRLGPFFMLVDGNDGSTSRTAYITTALSYAQTNSNWVSLETTFDGSNEDGNIAWDGKNNLYTGGPFSSSVGRVKRKIFPYQQVLTVDSTASSIQRKHCFAVDQNAQEHVFAIASSTTASNPWLKIRCSDGNITNLSNPPAGATNYPGASVLWDGSDCIYMNRGTSSTVWYKYTISTDTWTTMTPALPAATGSSNDLHHNYLIYIPKEVQGWAADRIFYRDSSGNMYRWGIGDGSWSAAVSGGENSNSNPSGESMTWDGGDEIYITRGSSELNRYNIATNTWTLSQDNLPASLEAGTELIYVNNYVNQIVVDNAGVTYWFFGDADHVTVIVKDTLNKYWFSYFGMIDTFESDSKLITTASVSAGSNSVSYSGLLDFAIGDKLYIYEPTSNKAERITVSATGVNSLTATFVNGYGSGSKISFDPQPVVTYAGHWDSVIPVHGALGPATTSGLNNPYQFNYMQQLIPPRPEVLRSTSPTSRNRYMMWPILVGSWKSAETIGVSSYATYYNAIDRITEKVLGTTDPSREIRGELMDVYVMKKTSSPLPVTGDKIVIGGKDYWIFECENLFEMEDWFIVVGPAE